MTAIRLCFVLLLIFILINDTDGFWGRRRRRRSSRRRRSFSFRRFVKVITTAVKTVVKGCCGMYPSVCRHRNEINSRKNLIAKMMRQINEKYARIKSQGTWLKTVNDNNGVIYGHIQRITEQSTEAIKMLDPRIIVKLNDVTNELKKSIQAHNATVMQFGIEDIEKEMDKTKGTVEENKNDLSVLGVEFQNSKIKKVADDMFKLAETKQIAQLIESSDGLKLTNAAQIKKVVLDKGKVVFTKRNALQIASKIAQMNPIVRNIQNVYKAALAIIDGFNKFIAHIKDIATCKKQKSTVEKNLRTIIKEQQLIYKTYSTLGRESVNLQMTISTMIASAKNLRLMKELNLIEDIAKQSSHVSSSRQAVTKILIYKDGITRSGANVPHLQTQLLAGLRDITYPVECYRRKVSTVQSIYRNCKKGVGSLDQLYEQAVVAFKPNIAKCVSASISGYSYTTKESVMKLVKEKGSKEFFEKNCLVNGVKRVLVCEDKLDGMSEGDIASQLKVDLNTIKSLTGTCASPTLSSQNVCKLKENKLSAATISSIFLVNNSEVQRMYNRC